MDELVQLFGYFALLFCASCAIAFGVATTFRKRLRLRLNPGALLRLRCLSGMYRSRVVSATAQGWTISAPLQRDNFVAIRAGETVAVEAADGGRAYRFKTEIISRDAETHELTIKQPVSFVQIERREGRRVNGSDAAAYLEGEEARIIDVSELGARVATRVQLSRGERVRLDMSGREEPVFGWVLETLPGSVYGYDSCEVRLRFEEELRLVPT